MPLWKLQTIGSERVEFLYEDREAENPREIVLKPGVAYCFRAVQALNTELPGLRDRGDPGGRRRPLVAAAPYPLPSRRGLAGPPT